MTRIELAVSSVTGWRGLRSPTCPVAPGAFQPWRLIFDSPGVLVVDDALHYGADGDPSRVKASSGCRVFHRAGCPEAHGAFGYLHSEVVNYLFLKVVGGEGGNRTRVGVNPTRLATGADT